MYACFKHFNVWNDNRWIVFIFVSLSVQALCKLTEVLSFLKIYSQQFSQGKRPKQITLSPSATATKLWSYGHLLVTFLAHNLNYRYTQVVECKSCCLYQSKQKYDDGSTVMQYSFLLNPIWVGVQIKDTGGWGSLEPG